MKVDIQIAFIALETMRRKEAIHVQHENDDVC